MYIPDKDWDALMNHLIDLEKTFQQINDRQVIVNTNLIHGLLDILINMQDQPIPVSPPSDVIPKHKRIRGHIGDNKFVFRDIPKNIRKRQVWVEGVAECIQKANEYGVSGVVFKKVEAKKVKKTGNWSTHIEVEYRKN